MISARLVATANFQREAPLIALLCTSACSAVANHQARISDRDLVNEDSITTIAGTGERGTDPVDGDSNGTPDPPVRARAARLDSPMDVASSREGALFILDSNGNKVRSLNPDGTLTIVAGTGAPGDMCESLPVSGACPAAATQLDFPVGVAVGIDGELSIAGWQDGKVLRLDVARSSIETICGQMSGDAAGASCRDTRTGRPVGFSLPSAVAYDDNETLFVSDQGNQIVRRISRDGFATIVAGTCPAPSPDGCPTGRGYAGDGGPATRAKLGNDFGPSAKPQARIVLDRHGRLFIADTGNHVVRRVMPGPDGHVGDGDPLEEIIETIAGTGNAGYSGDDGPAVEASLGKPTDVAVASDDTLYIADSENGCIRRVRPDGTIDTVAGRCGDPGFSGDDGPAIDAQLNQPYGIDVDGLGSLIIADTLNHRIRRVTLGARSLRQ
jgi:adhesin/invasin